jgi:hypothetical protein
MKKRTLVISSVLAVAVAALAFGSVATTTEPAFAEGGHSVIIPANDGYGLGECLAEGAACGRVVADAWCEAQGYGKADSFGPADPVEVTASIAVKPSATMAPKAYAISCRN